MNSEREKKILFENMQFLFAERRNNTEKMFYELSELSYLCAKQIKTAKDKNADNDFFEEDLWKEIDENKAPVCDVLQEYKTLLGVEQCKTVLLQKAAFSLFLSQRVEKRKKRSIMAQESCCIAYVRSPLAEIAYAKLEKYRKGATVLYVDGAEGALAAVVSSEADCALLPLTYLGGERIAAVERLSERYHMYLNACIDIGTEEGETVFGMFSLKDVPLFAEGEQYLEFRFTTWSYHAVSEILSFLPSFGFETIRFSCSADDDARVSARVVLKGDGDEAALWYYLSLAANGYVALGKYPLL